MPNIKSAEKRVQLTKVFNARNKAVKSELKTTIKKFDAAVTSGAGVNEAFDTAVSIIDKSAKKGVIHKNAAARKKSRLAKSLNA